MASLTATGDVTGVTKVFPGETATVTLTVADSSAFDGVVSFELSTSPLFPGHEVVVTDSTESGTATLTYVHDDKPGYEDLPVFVRVRATSVEAASDPIAAVISTDESLQVGLWEDLRFPSTALFAPGNSGNAPDRSATTGLLLFDDAAEEIIAGVAQIPHSYHEGSNLRPHIHIRSTTDPDGTGDTRWTLQYKWYNATDAYPADYTSDTITETVADHVDSAEINQIASFTAIDGTGKKVSSCFEWLLSRDGDDVLDTYAADTVLVEFDIHFLADSLGTYLETVKKG